MAERQRLIAVQSAEISKDRDTFTLHCQTAVGGVVTLEVAQTGLEQIVDALRALERMAFTIDPSDQKPGEEVQVRLEIVDAVQHGAGEVNGAPHLVIGLQTHKGPLRHFAFNGTSQAQLLEAAQSEIRSTPTRH